MTSLEKFKQLLDFDRQNAKLKITTERGEVYFCQLDSPAEGEEDWAYHFISPDFPTKYFILECDFISEIEEISDEEWQVHLNNLNIL